MGNLLYKLFDSAALLMLNYRQLYSYGQIQTSQTGGQPYSDYSRPVRPDLAKFRHFDTILSLRENFYMVLIWYLAIFAATLAIFTIRGTFSMI